jgi:hypothetical protein
MNLTQFLQKAVSSAPKTYHPFSGVQGGLPQGGLIELSGAAGGGKLEVLLRFLGENPGLQVAWVEEGTTTYPCAFPQHGVSLERVLFVNAEARHAEEGSLVLDCAHQILRSQIFGVLVLVARTQAQVSQIYPTQHTPVGPRNSRSTELRGCAGRSSSIELGEIELRRLQIAAEKSGTTIFVVRETSSSAHTWPLTVQLQVSRVSPSFGELRGELRIQVLKYKSQPRECFKDEDAHSQALA